MPHRLFLIAGDYSGDMHAARVVKALREQAPDLEIEAVGGQHLAELGVPLLSDQSKMGRVGFGAVLGAPYHYFLGRRILKHLETFQPDAVLLIDYGGFNLAMAAQLKRRGYRVFYFIPPQIWASRGGRIRKIKAYVDHVFCIFPFEKPLYESAGVPVTYVGHPLVGELPPSPDREAFCQQYGLDPKRPIVALMPGSRKLEIDYLLHNIIASLPLIQANVPEVQFVLAQAGILPDAYFQQRLQQARQGNAASIPITVIKQQNHAVLGVADAMIAASGTVTLEGALYNTPMVITYKLHPLIYEIAIRIRYLPCIGLPNILTDVDNPIAPELIQQDSTPEKLAQGLIPLLKPDSPERQRQLEGFKVIRETLNQGGAPQKVTSGILSLLGLKESFPAS